MLTLIPEYISQLEGEVAVKTQEANELKTANRSLAEENSRYRNLIETLLRHPAYVPFIEDFSKDPNLVAPQQIASSSMATTPVPSSNQDAVKQEDRRPGMPMLETPVDLSLLNLNNGNGNNFSVPSNASVNFAQPQIYAVHNIPQGPSPLELAAEMNASRRAAEMDRKKANYPVVSQMHNNAMFDSRCSTPASAGASFDADEFPLYANSNSPAGEY